MVYSPLEMLQDCETGGGQTPENQDGIILCSAVSIFSSQLTNKIGDSGQAGVFQHALAQLDLRVSHTSLAPALITWSALSYQLLGEGVLTRTPARKRGVITPLTWAYRDGSSGTKCWSDWRETTWAAEICLVIL